MPDYICNTSPLQYLYQLDRLGFRLATRTRHDVLKLAGEIDG